MYTFLSHGSLFVSSEAKSFMFLPKYFRLNLDRKTIILLGSKEPIYKKITQDGLYEFPPGYFQQIYPNGKQITQKWWDIKPYLRIDENRNYKDEVNFYRHLFNDALKLRLRSDADTCTALSGGLTHLQ